MLDEHATGWGLKREDDDIVLIWKGHNDVFVWKQAANMCRTPVDEQLSSGDVESSHRRFSPASMVNNLSGLASLPQVRHPTASLVLRTEPPSLAVPPRR
nr:scarecrow-like protein 32 isoform X1 [Ipomoea trifida]